MATPNFHLPKNADKATRTGFLSYTAALAGDVQRQPACFEHFPAVFAAYEAALLPDFSSTGGVYCAGDRIPAFRFPASLHCVRWIGGVRLRVGNRSPTQDERLQVSLR